MKYRKLPAIIEATQWFTNGDHPEDGHPDTEGDLVQHYRSESIREPHRCKQCGHTMHTHGWIDTLEGGRIVCPGDFIITGITGKHYPCNRDIFHATYEKAE